jgi:hypothetical protein
MLLGFKKQFEKPIQIGTKVFTLRKRRKVRPKIGEQLHMYTGLRTKRCELISNKDKLISIQNVRLMITNINPTTGARGTFVEIFVDRRRLTVPEVEQFVKYDGFRSVREWADYWLEGKDRTGALMELYHWTDLKY